MGGLESFTTALQGAGKDPVNLLQAEAIDRVVLVDKDSQRIK